MKERTGMQYEWAKGTAMGSGQWRATVSPDVERLRTRRSRRNLVYTIESYL